MPAVNNNYAGNPSGRTNGNYSSGYSSRNAGHYNRNNNDRIRGGYNSNERGNYGSYGCYGNGRGERERRDDFAYEIIESYGALSISSTGWTKELNRVSWNGKEPKFDIREWSPDHGRMRRGVTFTEEEALELRDLLEIAISQLPVSSFNDEEESSLQYSDSTGDMHEGTPLLDSGPLIDDVNDSEGNDGNDSDAISDKSTSDDAA